MNAPAVISEQARATLTSLAFRDVIALAGLERGEPREALSSQERWARDGVISLTAHCDGARAEDFEGFNKSDTNVGRYLGAQLRAGTLLDDQEWRGIVAICTKYHRQIGRLPAAEEHDVQQDARFTEAAATLRARSREVAALEKRIRQIETGEKKADVQIRRFENSFGVFLEVIAPSLETNEQNAAVVEWRAIPSRRWDRRAFANVIALKDSRALHALLEKHYAGLVANGPKGVFVIGGTVKK